MRITYSVLYSRQARWLMYLLVLSMTLLAAAGCASSIDTDEADSIPPQLAEHVTVSATPTLSQAPLSIYTAEIGARDIQTYIDIFFADPQNAVQRSVEDGTCFVRSPRDKLNTHPAVCMEYYALEDTPDNFQIFDKYSLFLSVLSSLYETTGTRPAGAHYDFLPDDFQPTQDLSFQSLAEAKNDADKRINQLEGYSESAYRSEIITGELMRQLYEQLDLSTATTFYPSLHITDQWFEDAGGYRFFYSMQVNGCPVYTDSRILQEKNTSDGAVVICPGAEVMTTKDGIIYVYVNAPIWNLTESSAAVLPVRISKACDTAASYFEDLALAKDTAVDIYKIQIEYAACRQAEAVTLQPVYAFYYTQGEDTGCLLLNAETGELL